MIIDLYWKPQQNATEENIARAMELGATECIAKPLEADELVDTVVRLIDDSSQARCVSALSQALG